MKPQAVGDLEQELRAAIVACPDSVYRLALRAGVSESQVRAFVRGGGLHAKTVQHLARALGCQLSLTEVSL